MSTGSDHVRGLVELTAKVQRDRIAYFADRPKRWSVIERILGGHETWHFDTRHWIDCADWTADQVVARLLAEGAPPHATIMFQGSLGGPITPQVALKTAIDRYFGSDDGVVVSCVPGRLVFFEGHEHGQRGILKR